MSNPTPERNVVREAQTVENYDPLAKQKAAAKLSRIPVKVEQAEVLKKPEWIRVKAGSPTTRFYEIKDILRSNKLVTVCEEASCPNIGECFGKGTATFMIMGDKCTRRCPFCDVGHGRPDPLDIQEPENLAQTIAKLGLNYVVITSVDRDDLRDGGADHYVQCITRTRELSPKTQIEVLVPDFRGRLDKALDIMAGRKEVFVQQPTDFYFPGLAQIQFFDTTQFDWVPALEAEAAAIRAELDGLLASRASEFRPYIHGDPNRAARQGHWLADDPDWSALFLCENGVRNEAAIAACPRTWTAMQAVPFPDIANSPTVMFSVLRAGARILPHTGMFNTRLVCHLPLIVPPDCHFRVGNEVRSWEPGKLLVFDDSIEHEAWNDSDQDRVVLIFDIWRPDLSEPERAELAALFAGKLD